ncbi:hypothetical protein HAX54_050805, partial [Datura stramonium]|nr:hypothetical protein [Datura stramonium]
MGEAEDLESKKAAGCHALSTGKSVKEPAKHRLDLRETQNFSRVFGYDLDIDVTSEDLLVPWDFPTYIFYGFHHGSM